MPFRTPRICNTSGDGGFVLVPGPEELVHRMVETSVGTRPVAAEGIALRLASQLWSDRRRRGGDKRWHEAGRSITELPLLSRPS